MLERLSDPLLWKEYYWYKKERRHLTRSEEEDLKKYIEHQEYLPVLERIKEGGSFSVPEKKLIRKMYTEKKRVVYLYPREENYLFKLLTYLLIRKYDHLFSENLYSFRAEYGITRAMGRILSTRGISGMYTYKVDISNYFNSISVDLMLKDLRESLSDDRELYGMFERILSDKRALDRGGIIEEEKGVMAGTPFAVFLANIYLMELDRSMKDRGVLYARYSDDIIVFTKTEEEREECAEEILQFLSQKKLKVNPKKEVRTSPGEQWTFLGISYKNGIIDISPVSKEKLKAKIRRKARNIKRWQVRKGAEDLQAVRAFIRSMNRKFFDCEVSSELTWTRWYFPLINTDATLKEIDRYMQEWVRYLATGRHSKKKYDFRYAEIKKAGYVSLVHEWYEYRERGFTAEE